MFDVTRRGGWRIWMLGWELEVETGHWNWVLVGSKLSSMARKIGENWEKAVRKRRGALWKRLNIES